MQWLTDACGVGLLNMPSVNEPLSPARAVWIHIASPWTCRTAACILFSTKVAYGRMQLIRGSKAYLLLVLPLAFPERKPILCCVNIVT